MKRKQFALVIFFIFSFILCISKEAKAADFYEHCLMPNGFGTGKDASNSMILSPLNRDCQKICQRECEAFSRKFKPYKMLNPNSIYAETFSVELNEDVISNCYSKCQKGGDDRFTSNYFDVFRASCEDEKNQDIFQKICVYKDGYGPASDCDSSLTCDTNQDKGYISFYKTIQQEKASVGMMCQGTEAENAYNVIETSFEAKSGDKFSFSLLGGASDNQLYLCGKKHIEIAPIFDNIDKDNWYKMRWKNKYSHRFLATISDDIFKSLKKKSYAKRYWDNIISADKFTYTKTGNIADDQKTLEDLEKTHGAQEFWQNISGDDYTLKNSRAGWAARNPNFFDTGIYLKNKDKLTVMWDGNYTSNKKIEVSEDSEDREKGINYPTKININNPNRQNIITDCIWNPNIKDQKNCIDRWYQNSSLAIRNPSSNSQQPSVTSKDLILEGECFRKGGINNFSLTASSDATIADDGYGCNLSKCLPDKADDKSKCEFGLLGNVMDSGVFKKYLDGNVDSGNGKPLDCTCKVADPKVPPDPQETTGCNNAYKKYQCIDKGTFEAGESKYVFQGIFKDSRFENRSKLALRHFYNDYSDDSGGYSMSIDWSGCPKSKSENIQYTVAKKGSHIGDDWKHWVGVNDSIVKKIKDQPDPKDLGFLIINPKSIAGNCVLDSKDCKIFLRIKLETPDASADDSMKETYKYYNTHGQYYVNMSKKGDSPMCSKGGLVYDTMKDIKTVLVGPDNSGTNSHLDYNIKLNQNRDVANFKEVGAVGVVFSGFVKQAAYVIKIILVLYLVFFAISYMLGLVDYTTQGFIKYIMKFAIVAFLISDTSWNFFGGYLVSFFIDGSIELVARYSASFLQAVSGNQQSCETMIIEDPYVIFSIFNGPIYQFIGGDTWSRIWAIFTNGLLGMVTAIFLVLAIYYYFVAVVKATVMFVFAIMINSVLIVTAPVFIVCLLFEKTKQMFDSWAKNLFSYALQPVFVYTSIIILNYVITILIYYVFNFTACSTCLVRVELGPLYNECWISGYQSMLDVHSPPDESGAVSIYSSFAVYAMTFTGGLVIYLIAQGMSEFSSHMSGVASWIVTGSPMRHMSIGTVEKSTSKFVKAKAQQAAIAVASAAVAVGTAAVGAGVGALAGGAGAAPGAAAGAGAGVAAGTGAGTAAGASTGAATGTAATGTAATGTGTAATGTGTAATGTASSNVTSSTASKVSGRIAENIRERVQDKATDTAIDNITKDDDDE
ncbi:MAG: type IV secretion system protein [Candidatus Midichloriaceae bacterium]